MPDLLNHVIPFVFILFSTVYMVQATRGIKRGHYLYPLRVHFRVLCVVGLAWRGPILFLNQMPLGWQRFYRDGSMAALFSILLGMAIIVLAAYIRERVEDDANRAAHRGRWLA